MNKIDECYFDNEDKSYCCDLDGNSTVFDVNSVAEQANNKISFLDTFILKIQILA